MMKRVLIVLALLMAFSVTGLKADVFSGCAQEKEGYFICEGLSNDEYVFYENYSAVLAIYKNDDVFVQVGVKNEKN